MKGIGISEGIAIGRAFLMGEASFDFSKWQSESVEKERELFQATRENILEQLRIQWINAQSLNRRIQQDIIEAHEMMLKDPELEQSMNHAITSGCNLPEAIVNVFGMFAKLMASLDDAYLKQRSHDYEDLQNQFLSHLSGKSSHFDMEPGIPWIPVAKDFAPSDINLVDHHEIKGFLCQGGATTTHFSILAKITGLPTVIQVQGLLEYINHGDHIIIDGETGKVIINPNPDEIIESEIKQKKLLKFQESLESIKSESARTLDGALCHIEGNIAGPQDVKKHINNGAEGIGLFRTEFIYMERTDPPSEDEQCHIYGQVLDEMGGKPVVIRTLDVGGDKEIPYLGIAKEENPFLGFRAVRFCLAHPEIFKTQIRALLRASVKGRLHIMVPMISGIEEIQSVKALIQECTGELLTEGYSVSDSIKLGIMIEVPAAATMAPLLAEEVDFFSIGTNDLIQYVMAADRMNEKVAYLYTPYHPAFIRSLKGIIDGAHASGIPVAVCGEIAGDPIFIPVLVGLGLDGYSMNASSILKARLRIRTLEKEKCQQLVTELLAQSTVQDIKNSVHLFHQNNPYGSI